MKPQRVRRTLLWLVALVLLACAGVWVFSHKIAPRLALRTAIGADLGEAQKFMATLAPMIGSERWRMTIRTVAFADPEVAAKAMDEGKLDLMIVRSDLAPRTRGQTLAIIRREAIALIVPADGGIEKFADLARKSIAIPEGPLQKQNEEILNQLLDFYAVPRASVARLFMPAGEVGNAVRQKRIAAVFAIGPAGFGAIPEAVASIRKTMRKPPSVLDLAEASAIVKRIPRLEAMEMPRGAVSGNPAIPDDTVNTLALAVRLLANASMGNSLAGDIAKVVNQRKSAFSENIAGNVQIEAPDTEDKNMLLPVHPGAEAYFSGDQPTLFDRIENFIYYGGLFAGIIGSLIAWAVGQRRASKHEHDEVSRRMSEILATIRELPDADAEKRRMIARDIETHADWALGELVAGHIDRDRYSIFETLCGRGRALLARA